MIGPIFGYFCKVTLEAFYVPNVNVKYAEVRLDLCDVPMRKSTQIPDQRNKTSQKVQTHTHTHLKAKTRLPNIFHSLFWNLNIWELHKFIVGNDALGVFWALRYIILALCFAFITFRIKTSLMKSFKITSFHDKHNLPTLIWHCIDWNTYMMSFSEHATLAEWFSHAFIFLAVKGKAHGH